MSNRLHIWSTKFVSPGRPHRVAGGPEYGWRAYTDYWSDYCDVLSREQFQPKKVGQFFRAFLETAHDSEAQDAVEAVQYAKGFYLDGNWVGLESVRDDLVGTDHFETFFGEE